MRGSEDYDDLDRTVALEPVVGDQSSRRDSVLRERSSNLFEAPISSASKRPSDGPMSSFRRQSYGNAQDRSAVSPTSAAAAEVRARLNALREKSRLARVRLQEITVVLYYIISIV